MNEIGFILPIDWPHGLVVAGVSTARISAEPFGFLHLFGCSAGISLVFGFSQISSDLSVHVQIFGNPE